MDSFSVPNKPHTKRENCQPRRHTNSSTHKKEIKHSLVFAIYHLNLMNYSLWRKAISQPQQIGSLLIKLNIYLLEFYLVDLVHHYFSLFFAIISCFLGSSLFHPTSFIYLKSSDLDPFMDYCTKK